MPSSNMPHLIFANSIFFLFCLSIISVYPIRANIVGIDFGEKYIKAVTITPQKSFEIVLGTQSNRKIFNAVTFEIEEQLKNLGPTTPSRVFGNDVEPFSIKRSQTSFIGSLSYLGKSYQDDENDPIILGINKYSHFYPIEHTIDEIRGTWNLSIKSETTLTPEEIVAHILSHIKSRVSETLHIPSTRNVSCVITIPCSFTQRQRQAIKDAAEIAGYHVLSLVHSNLAAGVEYALDVPFNETRNILFLSMGSQRVDLSVLKFEKLNITIDQPLSPQTSVKMLSCFSNEYIGGHAIDLAIAESMAEEFEKSYGVSLHEKPRALKLLLRQATKVKHVLSANKETKFSIESLYNDIDFKYNFTRQKLESLIDNLGIINHINESIYTTIQQANITFAELDGVELLGGTWRTPYVYNELLNIFSNITLGQHLNSDEAIAKGAAFIATSQSANYKVRPVEMLDIATKFYNLVFEETSDGITEEQPTNSTKYTLLAPHSKMLGNKKVKFYKSQDFKLKMYEQDKLINTYSINGLSEACQNTYPGLDAPKVQLIFKISTSGLIYLSDASATFEEAYNETITVNLTNSTENNDWKPYMTNVTSETVSDTSTIENSNITLPDNSTSNVAIQNSTEHTNQTYSDQQESTMSPKVETNVVSKTRTHLVKLKFDEILTPPLPLTSEQKANAKKNLAVFEKKDSQAAQLAIKRNTLESYIYSSKSQIFNDAYQNIATEAKIQEIKSLLSTFENWLYDEPFANLTMVSDKLEEVKNIIEPLNLLASEFEVRPVISEHMEKFLQQESISLNNMSSIMPWVDPNITYTLMPELDEVKKWWFMVKDKQISLPFDTFPAFTQSDVYNKIQQYTDKKTMIEKIPPPIPPKSPNLANSTNIDNSTQTPDSSTSENDTFPQSDPNFPPDNNTTPETPQNDTGNTIENAQNSQDPMSDIDSEKPSEGTNEFSGETEPPPYSSQTPNPTDEL